MTSERTGWRDEALSQRHRTWGLNCPAVDLDFVLVEYHYARPCALVEYKHANARPTDPTHPTIRAIIALADGYREGPLPCMVVRYERDPWTFRVVPLNGAAERLYGHTEGRPISEQDFVRSLYELRHRSLTTDDEQAIGRLCSTI